MSGSGRDKVDPAFGRQLAHAVEPIPRLVERSHHLVGRQPLRGSYQELDTAHSLGRYVREQGYTILGAAADHLETVHDLVHHVLPTAAHMTLLRSVVENAAWARWLLDPSISSDERIARGVAMQIKDYGQRREFEKSVGLDTTPATTGRHGGERREDLVKQRNELGVPTLTLPLATDVCESHSIRAGRLGGGAAYRLLSAFAHGRQWRLLLSRFEDAGFDPDPSGGRPMRVSANEDVAIAMTSYAVQQFAAAVIDAEGYPRKRPGTP